MGEFISINKQPNYLNLPYLPTSTTIISYSLNPYSSSITLISFLLFINLYNEDHQSSTSINQRKSELPRHNSPISRQIMSNNTSTVKRSSQHLTHWQIKITRTKKSRAGCRSSTHSNSLCFQTVTWVAFVVTPKSLPLYLRYSRFSVPSKALLCPHLRKRKNGDCRETVLGERNSKKQQSTISV